MIIPPVTITPLRPDPGMQEGGGSHRAAVIQ